MVPKPKSSIFHDDYEFSKLAVTYLSVIQTNQIIKYVFKTLMPNSTCPFSSKPSWPLINRSFSKILKLVHILVNIKRPFSVTLE